MTPEIELLSVVEINWDTLRGTLDKVLSIRPDLVINKLPIELSQDAEVLLNIAAFYGWDISNPLSTLRSIPSFFMEFLHYSFIIGCDKEHWDILQTARVTEIINKDLIIVTGSLAAWHDTIILNLGRDWGYSYESIYLLDKLILILERSRGLNLIFEKYKKKLKPDYTFLLEKK